MERGERAAAARMISRKVWQPCQGLRCSEEKCVVVAGDNLEQLVPVLVLEAHGILAESYHASLKTEDRERLSMDFRDPSNPLRVVVISPMMGSVGINLQGAATMTYCLSIPFHCAALDQAFARIIRIGQTASVHCVINALQSSFDTMWNQPHRRNKAGQENMAGRAGVQGAFGGGMDLDLDRVEGGELSRATGGSAFEALEKWYWQAIGDQEGWMQGYVKSTDPDSLR